MVAANGKEAKRQSGNESHNTDAPEARFVHLRATQSAGLSVWLEPDSNRRGICPNVTDGGRKTSLVLALVVFGGALLGGLLLMLPEALRDEPDGSRSMVWFAVAVVAAGGWSAHCCSPTAGSLRRQQRPDWLETQAGTRGMVEQVQKGQQRSDAPAVPPGPKTGGPEGYDQS